ncbi:HeH/LEM domain-containing protein [Lactococcus petauri]|uniref:HeH/LEM domain-containing protein n=1 Tax=Lactococcus petauri TaxID=1940789 RepID=UPI0022DF41D6|nr:HeH/LEM domain-containing protein [Lactococcus petauri]
MGRLISRHLHEYKNVNATKQVKNDELTTLTVIQLKELLENKGIEYTKNDKKSDLISKLGVAYGYH